MKNLLLIVGFVAGLSSLTGCATMLNGSTRQINVQAQNGKEVKMEAQTKDGVVNLTAPSTLNTTASSANITISVTDPCYRKTQTVVSKKIALSFWANAFNNGIGSTTDSSTGDMWTYDENVVVPVVETGTCK